MSSSALAQDGAWGRQRQRRKAADGVAGNSTLGTDLRTGAAAFSPTLAKASSSHTLRGAHSLWGLRGWPRTWGTVVGMGLSRGLT